MGTDNLFHRRKARKAADLKRQKAKRAPFAKVFIVCEGGKTEPNYFSGIKDHYELNSANIEVCTDGGSDPLGIYNFAMKRFKREKSAGDPFDKIYCVFDKDNRKNFAQALVAIRSANPKHVFFAIPSVPCIEFWFLLHYEYTTRLFSKCDQVIDALRCYLPDYTKGIRDMFPMLLENLESAKINAERAKNSAAKSGTDNPTTCVHQLVEFLQNIKNQ